MNPLVRLTSEALALLWAWGMILILFIVLG